jgi:hypothetical protein
LLPYPLLVQQDGTLENIPGTLTTPYKYFSEKPFLIKASTHEINKRKNGK